MARWRQVEYRQAAMREADSLILIYKHASIIWPAVPKMIERAVQGELIESP